MYIISFTIPNNHRKSVCMYLVYMHADIEVGVCICACVYVRVNDSSFYPITLKHVTNLSTLERKPS